MSILWHRLSTLHQLHGLTFDHMKSIKTSIDIKAPAARVWEVLTNFGAYKEWNPFIISSEGRAEVGSRLRNGMQLKASGKPQFFNPKILKADTSKELRWRGSLFFRGIFDGEHYFQLEQLADGKTRLVQGEKFSGILSGPILGMILEDTVAGFKAMNEALKKRAEAAG